MGPKPYLTTIFKLLGWILLDVIRDVFVARYLTKLEGLPAEKSSTIKFAKALKVKSQVIHSYL